ncbi:PAS domain-containing protein [Thalassobius vesicularis]|uniref:PAS domain-containing protein n=1 Tax=Thalassobius vesicularis TaxID=1294297 RepID=A0A4S3MF93_9RHOB|nr:PAS-domain containing protein [Thalassobius vesicularis]THD76828.1 PAS domain-containing protein [Thalassobius vesicularis]
MIALTTILLTSLFSATAAGAAAYHIMTHVRPVRSARGLPDHDARFLFEGRRLLNASGGGEWLLETGQGRGATDWEQLREVLMPRFPSLPEAPEEMDADIITCPTNIPEDDAELLLERINDLTRVTLLQAGNTLAQPADIHAKLLSDRKMDTLTQAVEGSPYPIWATDCENRITWANEAYLHLADNAHTTSGTGLPVLFDLPEPSPTGNPRTRLSLTLKDNDSNIWFDVTSSKTKNGRMHYAIDINAVVQAEIAQRNFVQTLTKTFAQLSIGLVIFDRKRQLALFNPALIDLLSLSPEFLSARPSLLSFFDRLRDMQIMPEPKNYGSWRENLTELIDAAADGRYAETWSLPNGLTYRVSGRPHPDGAIAFLFEDISSEVLLTRRFRAQLDMLQSVVDGLPQAVAVFSSAKVLLFANSAYRVMWDSDPDSTFADMSLTDATRLWRTRLAPGADLSELRPGLTHALNLPLDDGGCLSCSVRPLIGGAFAVNFTEIQAQPRLPLLEQPA